MITTHPHDPSHSSRPLLRVRELQVHFNTPDGLVRAVDAVNLDLGPGGRLGLLGESGCGKTILALALLGLLPPGAHVTGSVKYRGEELVGMKPRELRRIRKRGIGIVFEQPSAYLNPLFPAGWQVAEAVRLSRGCSRARAKQRALRLLDMARIPEARKRYRQYPHQLSGGMRQRVMIAMALAKDPDLLVADEPTTALDQTVKQRILTLLRACLDETGAACLCITHDWELARGLCNTAAVMYAGHILETGPVAELLDRPRHPYSRALQQAMANDVPRPIPGQPPALTDIPGGCRFAPRCADCGSDCAHLAPMLNHGVRCHAVH